MQASSASSASAKRSARQPKPSPPSPIVTRSNIRVVRPTAQPLSTAPTSLPGSSRTSSRKTSLKWASPEIWRSGRTRDPLGVHRDDEHRQALVLRDVGVRAGQQQAEAGVLRVGGPDLLAGEAPGAVLLLLGAGLDPGEVGARGRLAEQLAPDLVGGQHRAEVALLLVLAAVRDQRRPEHPHADDVEDPGHAGAADLLVDDDLLERAEAGAAVLGRPRHGGEPGLGEAALPGAAGGDGVLVVGAALGRLGAVRLQPGADAGAVLGQLRRVVQVQGRVLLMNVGVQPGR